MSFLSNFSRLIFICVGMFGISCGAGRNLDNEELIHELPPSIIESETSLYLYSHDMGDSAKCGITYDFYSDIDLPYKDTVNWIIKKFTADNSEFTFDHLTDSRLSHNFFRTELEKFRGIYNDAVSNDGYDYGVWEVEIDVDIDDSFRDFVIVGTATWAYSGGAHGNGFMVDNIVDKKTGKVLGLDDFFSDINELNRICDPIFRKSQSLTLDESLSDAGFWFDENQFSVNNNFSCGDGFVKFYFNPYEIAPYAAGAMYVSVHIDEVKHLLLRSVD